MNNLNKEFHNWIKRNLEKECLARGQSFSHNLTQMINLYMFYIHSSFFYQMYLKEYLFKKMCDNEITYKELNDILNDVLFPKIQEFETYKACQEQYENLNI